MLDVDYNTHNICNFFEFQWLNAVQKFGVGSMFLKEVSYAH